MFKISDEEGAAGNTAAMGPTKMHLGDFFLLLILQFFSSFLSIL